MKRQKPYNSSFELSSGWRKGEKIPNNTNERPKPYSCSVCNLNIWYAKQINNESLIYESSTFN